MSFFRGFSLSAVSTGLVFALGWVNQWLLANHLDKAEYGRLGLWAVTVVIGAMLFGEWLRRGSTYVVGRQEAGAPARDNAVLFFLAILAGGMGLAYAGAGAMSRVLGPEAKACWPLLGALPALVVLQRSGQAVLLGLDRIRPYAAVPVLFIAVYLAGNSALLLTGHLRLETTLLLFAGAAGLAGLAAFAMLVRTGDFTWGDGRVLRRTVAVGWRGAASAVLIFLLLKSDVFLIDYFLDDAAVGSYRVATQFAEMMQRVPDVAGAILLAKVVRDQDEDRLSLRVARWVLIFSVAAALVLLAAGKSLIGWFFPAYPESFLPLAWMLPGLVFLGLGSVCNIKLAGKGYPTITLWAAAVAFVLNFALNLYLIPALGLKGAALSTTIAYTVWALLVGTRFLRMEGVDWGALLYPRSPDE